MLSRAASSIYWMSRYLERAENVARIVSVNIHLMLDMGLTPQAAQWKPLITTSGDEADFTKRYTNYTEKNVLNFLTFDAKNFNSIYSCICSARENARTVRDVISSEMWEQTNALYHLVQKYSRKKKITDWQDFYVKIRAACNLLSGLSENTMSHGEGWHFARMGRLLERADKTARILDVKYFLLLPNAEDVDSPYDAVEWGAVLKSASAFEMYRKHFHHINYKDVADFLILNPIFPRSMLFCITAASESLNAIINELDVKVDGQKEMKKLLKNLSDADIKTVLGNGLHEFIDIFQFNLNIVDQAIYRSFFASN